MNNQDLNAAAISFVQHGYDRCSLHRKRSRYLKTSIDNGEARLLFIHDRKVGLRKSGGGFEAALVDPGSIPKDRRDSFQAIFLGKLNHHPIFAISCDEHPRHLLVLGSDPILFFDLRQSMAFLEPEPASLLGYALAMDHWHRTHRFCGVCGNSTEFSDAGHMRVCTNRDCARKHFPRTDPAVIVLVTAEDACLLGRKREWQARRYSTLAGFVEPGETPEQAVCREVYEETGTTTYGIRYFASQPWPFPGSLMLGYYASAVPGAVRLHDEELQDARWYSRENIRAWVPSGKLRLPTKVSIAYKLLENWFNQDGGTPLSSFNPD